MINKPVVGELLETDGRTNLVREGRSCDQSNRNRMKQPHFGCATFVDILVDMFAGNRMSPPPIDLTHMVA